MIKKTFKLFAVLILFLIIPIAYADGMWVPDETILLYEPDQKAVIVWDGETETMILSASVRSEELANFAWVVPIQSSVKPEVTEGNISVFEDLVKYFTPKRSNILSKGIMFTNMAEGVQVLETKQIDVYDIAIIKATNSDDLIYWLNSYNFKIPENAKPIFDKYVEKGDAYFIANRLDFTNKVSSATIQRYEEEMRLNNISSDTIQKYERVRNSMSEEIMYKYYSDILDDDEIKYHELKEKLLEDDDINEYYKLRERLRKGIGTPLKFEFKPPQPYYPLEISSLNEGYTDIEVYVLSNKEVKDKNSILKFDKSKTINSELRLKLEEHLDLNGITRVTRLTYYGKLSELNADAVFIKYTFFQYLKDGIRKSLNMWGII